MTVCSFAAPVLSLLRLLATATHTPPSANPLVSAHPHFRAAGMQLAQQLDILSEGIPNVRAFVTKGSSETARVFSGWEVRAEAGPTTHKAPFLGPDWLVLAGGVTSQRLISLCLIAACLRSCQTPTALSRRLRRSLATLCRRALCTAASAVFEQCQRSVHCSVW